LRLAQSLPGQGSRTQLASTVGWNFEGELALGAMPHHMELGSRVSDGRSPEGPAKLEVQTLHPKPTEDPMIGQAGQQPAVFHIVQSGIVLQAHLDLFEWGIARRLTSPIRARKGPRFRFSLC
jgi:hypothetical protein